MILFFSRLQLKAAAAANATALRRVIGELTRKIFARRVRPSVIEKNEMTGHKQGISIWFFIGALLLVYGILTLGADLYYHEHPIQRQVELSHLRPGLWWGLLLIALGAFYSIHFRPRKQ
jgi:hypothetical protein